MEEIKENKLPIEKQPIRKHDHYYRRALVEGATKGSICAAVFNGAAILVLTFLSISLNIVLFKFSLFGLCIAIMPWHLCIAAGLIIIIIISVLFCCYRAHAAIRNAIANIKSLDNIINHPVLITNYQYFLKTDEKYKSPMYQQYRDNINFILAAKKWLEKAGLDQNNKSTLVTIKQKTLITNFTEKIYNIWLAKCDKDNENTNFSEQETPAICLNDRNDRKPLDNAMEKNNITKLKNTLKDIVSRMLMETTLPDQIIKDFIIYVKKKYRVPMPDNKN